MAKTWNQALEELKPFIFKIATPDGYGTGFQVLYPQNRQLCGIATAYHVVDHAEEWEESIKITHYSSGKSVVLKESDRVIFTYPAYDLAFILFNKSLLPLEQREPLLIGPQKILKQGVEIGWCGFPAIAPPNELCFFAGHTSYCHAKEDYYLVDGVAINGVSGGPAFYIDRTTEEVKIAGVISAYRANRVHGEVYPGLSKICSVDPYQEMLKDLRSLEEADEKAKEVKEEAETEVSIADVENPESSENVGSTKPVPKKKKSVKKTEVKKVAKKKSK